MKAQMWLLLVQLLLADVRKQRNGCCDSGEKHGSASEVGSSVRMGVNSGLVEAEEHADVTMDAQAAKEGGIEA